MYFREGYPVAFNPNYGLFEVARDRGWPLVVERKDVIYNLSAPLGDRLLNEGVRRVE